VGKPKQRQKQGHCSKDETVAMAIRAQKMGMRVMINIMTAIKVAGPTMANQPKMHLNNDKL
jgi:arabinogalactan endo-1,4-beta-galactosidase